MSEQRRGQISVRPDRGELVAVDPNRETPDRPAADGKIDVRPEILAIQEVAPAHVKSVPSVILEVRDLAFAHLERQAVLLDSNPHRTKQRIVVATGVGGGRQGRW